MLRLTDDGRIIIDMVVQVRECKNYSQEPSCIRLLIETDDKLKDTERLSVVTDTAKKILFILFY